MTAHTFYCGLDPPTRAVRNSHFLRAHGAERNIHLHPLTISRRLVTSIPPRLLDLIDIAAYVFVADRIASRGNGVGKMGDRWRRRLSFKIAVRQPDHWSDPELQQLLTDVLGFVSDDDYQFDFDEMKHDPPEADYFRFPDATGKGEVAGPVVLFSGGLDSLAGALEELESGRQRVLLVSHQSSSIVTSYQNELVKELSRFYLNRILHVPVRLQLYKLLDREGSQRSRTFLYSCIAGVVAALVGAPGIRYYENGIMSLNLPLSAQVVGTAATRSTHPRTLSEMSLFLESAIGASCAVDNPFLYKTKAEVLLTLASTGHKSLIDRTFTCTKIRQRTAGRSHCGGCLQCLHRRIAVLAAFLGDHDRSEKYALDLFESPREGPDLAMVADLVRQGRQFHRSSNAEAFFSEFPMELARLSNSGLPGEPEQILQCTFELHRRFGEEVMRVIAQGLQTYKERLAKGTMPPGSLLTLIVHEQRGEEAQIGVSDVRRAADPPRGAGAAIELMVDVERGEYAINDRPPRREKRSTEFLGKLAAQHRKDTRAEAPSSSFQYLSSAKLAAELGTNQQALGRLVERLRNRFSEEIAASGQTHTDRGIVVQSRQWRGYRLNPAVRIVARGD